MAQNFSPLHQNYVGVLFKASKFTLGDTCYPSQVAAPWIRVIQQTKSQQLVANHCSTAKT
ncbi:hypothetical protein INR49_015307 [Caranx melampygus]|nr:hypothetical protein INR49_015307 [Caranx melampygus]